MARADLLSMLYSKKTSPLQFKFDSLIAPNMYSLITMQDVYKLYLIATSLKYSGDIGLKRQMIDSVLVPRGFKKFGCGTNRIVYKHLEYTNILLKIALDRVGLEDNPAEYENQFLLQPFVAKMFQVSQCGTVALVERVQPITSHEEFKVLAEDIFDLLVKNIIGQYVLEDVGTKYFMNYGFRNGFGPVILDYTYVYKLDGAKLRCNSLNRTTGVFCDGEIDYDDGFNNLICMKCRKRYFAKQLQEDVKNNIIKIKGRGEMVKIRVTHGDDVIIDTNLGQKQSKVINRQAPPPKVTVTESESTPIQQKENANSSIEEATHSMNNFINTVVGGQGGSAPVPGGGRTISADDFARQMQEAMLGQRTELTFNDPIIPQQPDNIQLNNDGQLPKKAIEMEGDYANVNSTFIPEQKDEVVDKGTMVPNNPVNPKFDKFSRYQSEKGQVKETTKPAGLDNY